MLRLSTGAVNLKAAGYSDVEVFKDFRFLVYTGTQPTTADAVPTGTKLMEFTLGGNAYAAPTKATATLTLSGSGANGGSIDTVKVGGMAFNLIGAALTWANYPSLALLTDAVAAAINTTLNPLKITAVSNGVSVITLSLPFYVGAGGNGLTVAATVTAGTSLAVTPTNFAGGVTAVNGLNFTTSPIDGVVEKPVAADWKATAIADGAVGSAWFRIVAGGSSENGISTTDVRLDGSISNVGVGDIATTIANVVAGSIHTFGNDFTLEELKEAA